MINQLIVAKRLWRVVVVLFTIGVSITSYALANAGPIKEPPLPPNIFQFIIHFGLFGITLFSFMLGKILFDFREELQEITNALEEVTEKNFDEDEKEQDPL